MHGGGSAGVSHKPASPTGGYGASVALIAHMSRSNSHTTLVEDSIVAVKEEVKFQGRYVSTLSHTVCYLHVIVISRYSVATAYFLRHLLNIQSIMFVLRLYLTIY